MIVQKSTHAHPKERLYTGCPIMSHGGRSVPVAAIVARRRDLVDEHLRLHQQHTFVRFHCFWGGGLPLAARSRVTDGCACGVFRMMRVWSGAGAAAGGRLHSVISIRVPCVACVRPYRGKCGCGWGAAGFVGGMFGWRRRKQTTADQETQARTHTQPSKVFAFFHAH